MVPRKMCTSLNYHLGAAELRFADCLWFPALHRPGMEKNPKLGKMGRGGVGLSSKNPAGVCVCVGAMGEPGTNL